MLNIVLIVLGLGLGYVLCWSRLPSVFVCLSITFSTFSFLLAPISIWLLVAAIALLTATAWVTVVQRILFVRKQLRGRL